MDFIERLKKEQQELQEKIEKLLKFINKPEFYELPEEQITLLHLQSAVMQQYNFILQRRLAIL